MDQGTIRSANWLHETLPWFSPVGSTQESCSKPLSKLPGLPGPPAPNLHLLKTENHTEANVILTVTGEVAAAGLFLVAGRR